MNNGHLRFRRSDTTSRRPTTLDHGELAINYEDGVIFYKDNNEVIQELARYGGANASPQPLVYAGTTDIKVAPNRNGWYKAYEIDIPRRPGTKLYIQNTWNIENNADQSGYACVMARGNTSLTWSDDSDKPDTKAGNGYTNLGQLIDLSANGLWHGSLSNNAKAQAYNSSGVPILDKQAGIQNAVTWPVVGITPHVDEANLMAGTYRYMAIIAAGKNNQEYHANYMMVEQ